MAQDAVEPAIERGEAPALSVLKKKMMGRIRWEIGFEQATLFLISLRLVDLQDLMFFDDGQRYR
jgi:hypothetical protein